MSQQLEQPNNLEFITNDNIEMLWEIILDDLKDKLQTTEKISHARGFFINQARIFFERENSISQTLIQLNKKFISQIMTSFTSIKIQQPQMQPQTQNQNQNQKINISNKEYKPHFTIEDLHSERLNAFEKSLEEKKNDFLSAMTIPVPESPKFNDSNLDKPIGSAMDELIARTLAQRNFEIENINKNINKNEVEKWLKPAETSIKTEKIQENENVKLKIEQKQIQYKYQETPKLIQIGPVVENVDLSISSPVKLEKKITWGENSEYESNHSTATSVTLDIKEVENKTDLFSKLKQIKKPQPQPQPQPTVQYEIIEITKLNERMNSLEEKIDKIIKHLFSSQK